MIALKCNLIYEVEIKALVCLGAPKIDMYKYQRRRQPSLKPKRYRNENNKTSFIKAFRFAFVCALLTIFVATFSATISLMDKNDTDYKFKDYDDLIWPIVMQNPLPFNEVSPPSNETMLRASLWDLTMKSQCEIDKWSENDGLVLSEDEVKASVKRLFNKEIEFCNFENSENYFYTFDREKKEFLVYATSCDNGFLPHTIDVSHNNGNIILNVGYVSPKNQFSSTMDKIFENKIEKFAKYTLAKNSDTGELYIAAVM